MTSLVSRGGSWIPRLRGANPRGGGAPTYDFAKFSEKLHDIEKILVRREAPRAPLDPSLVSTVNDVGNKYYEHGR